MRLTTVVMLIAAAASTLPAAAHAQLVTFDARVGPAAPRGDFGNPPDDRTVLTDMGWEVKGMFHITPYIGAYAAFAKVDFSGTGRMSDRGVSAGGLVLLPVATDLSVILRAGAVRHSVQASRSLLGAGFQQTNRSEPHIGYEVGTGARLPFLDRFAVTAEARYVSYNVNETLVSDRFTVDVTSVQYLAFDIGISVTF